MNCKSNLRLLRNLKYVCWSSFSKFLTFNYLKCCVKTVSLKTWHCTGACWDQELLWAALSDLNKPSALAQVSCCGQKPKLTLLPSAQLGSHCSEQGRSTLGKHHTNHPNPSGPVLCPVCRTPLLWGGAQPMELTMGYRYYRNTLSSPT